MAIGKSRCWMKRNLWQKKILKKLKWKKNGKSTDMFHIFMCYSMKHVWWSIQKCNNDDKGKNAVVRCRNITKGIRNTIKKKRKKRQKASTSNSNPTPRSTRLTPTTIMTDKNKSHIDENLRNFLRQYLKKSFSMTDLRLQSYRTDEFIHKLFYETTRFSAFNHQWIVKAIVNNSQRDVHQSNDRFITYQVISNVLINLYLISSN